ncbi:MAG: hypothetical protein ACYS1A_04790 [Planctomycetota bacterium]|jgi:hypothetical protein
MSADLRKLLGLEAGRVFFHIEGGWSNTEGINDISVGGYFGVNAEDEITQYAAFVDNPTILLIF